MAFKDLRILEDLRMSGLYIIFFGLFSYRLFAEIELQRDELNDLSRSRGRDFLVYFMQYRLSRIATTMQIVAGQDSHEEQNPRSSA